MLKYCKTRKENKNYSEKEEKLYQEIKKLNKRGTKGIGYP
jgi:cell division protein FtsB